MVLYLIGLGLGDEKDITVKGLEVVRRCAAVFLEAYTSVLGIDKQRLEEFYGVPIVEADRNTVESEAESIYERAKDEDIAFLVVGDPLCATTHTDLIIRAKNVGAEVRVIHNASVMGAVASCGLQLYNFGQTVSIPLFEGEWRPTSFLPKLQYNRAGGMHTLCLLDIKVKEPDFDALAKGKLKYLPPRFMTVNVAIRQLLEADPSLASCAGVGMARLGQPSQTIVYGTLDELKYVDFGPPLHCLALCGEVHPLEEEVLQFFHVSKLPDEARTAGRHLYEEAEERESEASQASEPPY